MADTINRKLRFTKRNPCPLCDGGDDDLRGKDRRCYGFISSNGQYIHCTRIGNTTYHETSQTYAHKRYGLCRCGVTHNPDPNERPYMPPKRDNARADRKLEAEYLYRDATGVAVHRVRRFRLGNGAKTFAVEHTDGQQWVPGLGEQPRLLYRLPELLAAPRDIPVYIVEGEKCVDTLHALGFVATTNMGGAEKWHLTSGTADVLAGRHVVILPDNDAPGIRHAQQVATAAHPVAASIKVVMLPNLPQKGDISDWTAEGHTPDDLCALVAASTAWHPNQQDLPGDEPEPLRYHLMTAAEVMALPPVEWLIEGVLPEGAMSFAVGEEGSGKSFLTLDWGLCVALGHKWLVHPVKQGTVVYLAGEGLYGIGKRMHAWQLTHGVTAIPNFYVLGDAVPLLQPEAVNDLIDALEALPTPPKLVIFDTFARALVGGDENSSKDTGLAIAAADRLRKRFGAHTLIIQHKNKMGGVRGSTAIPGAADTMVDVVKDGQLVTISCTKQKDFEKFLPYYLTLQHVQLDGGITSCVLTGDMPSPATFLTESQRKALQALDCFGEDGALASEWQKAATIPESTFYAARSALDQRGFTAARTQGNTKRYCVSSSGKEMLANTTPITPIVLQREPLERGDDTPPHVMGGVSPNAQASVGADVAEKKTAGTPNQPLSFPPHKNETKPASFPLPTKLCPKCGRVAWAKRPDGYTVCSYCQPPTSWRKSS